MSSPPIIFRKQALDPADPQEPIVLLPARELGSGAEFIISLEELDSFVDQKTGASVREGAADLLLTSFSVRSEPIPGTSPPKFRWGPVMEWLLGQKRKRTRGVLHGVWSDGIRFEHHQPSASEHEIRGARRLGDSDIEISGKMLDDATVELAWCDPGGFAATARLRLTDDMNALFGHYWYDGETLADAEKKLDRRIFLERATRHEPGAPPAGIYREVVFEGARPWEGKTTLGEDGAASSGDRYKVWIPVEELQQEFHSALVLNGRTKRAKDKVYLEIGYAVRSCAAGEHDGPMNVPVPIHCEVPVPYDHEAAVHVAEQSIFLHAVLFAQEIDGAPRARFESKMAELARVLGEDLAKGYDACPKFLARWEAGYLAGADQAEEVHVSIAFRFAAEGQSVGPSAAHNPFPKSDMRHWELEWFRRKLPDFEPEGRVRPDPRWSAYLKGRQVWKLRQEGAHSMSPDIPSDLLAESAALGLEPETATAFFNAGWESAREQKMFALVKAFAATGYQENSVNPFRNGPEAKDKAARDFDLAQELLATGCYDEAFQEGRALHRIFVHGQRVGMGNHAAERSFLPDLLREQASLAKVELHEAEQLYDKGFAHGEALRLTIATDAWLRDNLHRLRGVVVGFLEDWHRDEESRRLEEIQEAAAEWPAIVSMRGEVEGRGGAAAIFDAAVQREVIDGWPHVERQMSKTWIDGLRTMGLNTGEWLGLGLWAAFDALTWPVCKLAGWDTWTQSGEWVEKLRDGFEDSAFRAIGPGDSLLGLWSDAFLGVGQSFLNAAGVHGVLRSAALGVGSIWTSGVAGMSWGALGSTLLLGGARWSAANLAKVVGTNVALSSALGLVEEAADAYYEERDFEIDNATANVLRNTTTFVAFGALRGACAASGMAKLYDSLALVHIGAGFVQLGARYAGALATADEAERVECERAFVQHGVTSMLLLGVKGVQTLLANGAAGYRSNLPRRRAAQTLSEPGKIRSKPKKMQRVDDILPLARKDSRYGSDRVSIDHDIVLRGKEGGRLIIRKTRVHTQDIGGVTLTELRALEWYVAKTKGTVVCRPPPYTEMQKVRTIPRAQKTLSQKRAENRRWRRVGNTSDAFEYSGGMPRNIDVYTPSTSKTGTMASEIRDKLAAATGQTAHVIVDLSRIGPADLPRVTKFFSSLLAKNRKLGRQVDVIHTRPGASPEVIHQAPR
jgi:hypothetical protein